MKLLRRSEVLAMLGISRKTMYRLIAQKRFPDPVVLGPRTIRWTYKSICVLIQGGVNGQEAGSTEVVLEMVNRSEGDG